MTATLSSFLDGLKTAADAANKAEDEFRRNIAARTKALEAERAFAFRRLNLMRAIAEAIATAESEEAAIAGAKAELRSRLGWSSDSDARDEVLSRFAVIAQAMFAQLAPEDAEGEPADAAKALAEFEAWYAATHPMPFWVLFENVMQETPVVDF
jgi:hypothetical protein